MFIIRKTAFKLLCILSIFIVMGCDIPPSLVSSDQDVFDNIQITPINRLQGTDQLMTHIGFEQLFIATSEINGVLKDVTDEVQWDTQEEAIATATLGRALGRSVGKTKVYASSGFMQSDALFLTVNDAQLVKLQIFPNPKWRPLGALQNKLSHGVQQEFIATAFFDDNTTLDVSAFSHWATNNEDVIAINRGNVTAVGIGDSFIHASLNGIDSNALEIIVTNSTLTELHISPASLRVAKGSTVKYQAQAIFSDHSTQNVTNQVNWFSQITGLVEFTENQAQALKVGETIITASMLGIQSTEKAKLNITDSSMVSLQITPAINTLSVGSQFFYTALARYLDGSTQDVTQNVQWRSSEPQVAEVIAGYSHTLDIGSTQVSAHYQTITSNTAQLEVNSSYLTTLQISPPLFDLALNTSEDIHVYATYSDESTRDVTQWVTWNINSSETAAILDKKVLGLKAGDTQFTAHFNQSTSNTAKVNVKETALTSLQITPAIHTMTVGDEVDYKVTATFEDESNQDVTHLVLWKIKDHNIAGVEQGKTVGHGIGNTPVEAHLAEQEASATLYIADKYIDSIQITPANESIAKGTFVHFTAIAHYNDDSLADMTNKVSWASNDASIATVEQGDVTGVTQGSVSISANYQDITSNLATLQVTDSILDSILITPARAVIPVGMTQEYRAEGTYSDGHVQDLTHVVDWQSHETNIATISQHTLTIHERSDGQDHEGESALAFANMQGETHIHASISGIESNDAQLTVTQAVLETLQVTPGSASIAKGTDQDYQVTGVYSDGTNKDVTHLANWTNSMPIYASINEGHAQGIGLGQTKITASIGEIKSNTVTLDVTSATVKSLQITPASSNIPNGTDLYYHAIASYSDNTTQDVTELVSWKSSDTDTATILGGDAHGISVGNVTVQAFMGQTQSNIAHLSVSAASLSLLQLTPADLSVAKGTEFIYKVTGTYSDQTQKNLTEAVNWHVSKPYALTISNGFAQTLEKADIAVYATHQNKTSNTVALTVTDATVRAIQISPSNHQMAKGSDLTYLAQAIYSDGRVQDVTSFASWQSSNPQGVTIFKGVAHGERENITTDITAIFNEITSNTASLSITEAVLNKIQISPSQSNIALGIEQDFTAIGTYSDNSTHDLTKQVAWNNSDNKVATLLEGHLISVTQGETEITAYYQEKTSNKASVTVTQKQVQKLQLSSTKNTIIKGASHPIDVKATYTDGSTRFITHEVTWDIESGEKVSIEGEILTGMKEGSTVIRAYWLDDKIYSNAINITVSAPLLQEIYISDIVNVKIGTTKQIYATGEYSDESQADITHLVSWISTDSKLATVVNGLVKGISVGNIQIYAVLNELNAVTAVKVEHGDLTSITLTPGPNVKIPIGTDLQFVATATFTGGETEILSENDGLFWSTNSPNLSISNSGLATADIKTTQSISVFASKGLIQGSATIEITPAIAKFVEVKLFDSNTSPILTLGSRRQLFAFATMTDNSVIDVTNAAYWYESSNSAFTTANRGSVGAIGIGASNITASYQGIDSNPFQMEIIPASDVDCATPEVTIDGLTFICTSKVKSDLTITGDGYTAVNGEIISRGNLATAKADCASKGARLPTMTEIVIFRIKAGKKITSNYGNVYANLGWPVNVRYWTSKRYNNDIQYVFDMNTGSQYINTIYQNLFLWTCVKP